jgi:protein-tyrosine phosphatase
MAEAICRAEMAQRFPHTYDPANVVISSAGLSAFPGGPASPEAVQVLKKKGLDLLHHQSRSVTERTLRQADLVLTMSNSHRTAILERMPMLAEKVHLLSGTAADVADPFGGSESVYADCADQIEKYIQSWLGRIDESWFPIWRQGVS